MGVVAMAGASAGDRWGSADLGLPRVGPVCCWGTLCRRTGWTGHDYLPSKLLICK